MHISIFNKYHSVLTEPDRAANVKLEACNTTSSLAKLKRTVNFFWSNSSELSKSSNTKKRYCLEYFELDLTIRTYFERLSWI